MGCKVEKIILDNGQSSDLFRELSFGMPGARALETYLELATNKEAFIKQYGENKQGEVDSKAFLPTPKFKLAEFDTYQQQVDTMDMLAGEFISALKSRTVTSSDTTITGINVEGLTKDPLVIPELIREIRQKIVDEIAVNNYSVEHNKLLMQAAQNLPSYLGEDQRLGPLGAKLVDYGITINVSDRITEIQALEQELTEVNEDVDLELVETQYERIYDMDILETSASNSILEQVKIYLRSLKRVDSRYKYSDKRPSPTFELSELGEDRPARYELIVGKMFALLKGMRNVEDMKERIYKSLKNSPELTPIYNDLTVEVPITLSDGTLYKPIATALFTTFSKQDYNMFTIAEKTDGNIIFTQSNVSSVQNKLKARWEKSIKDVQKSFKTRKGKVFKKEQLALIDAIMNPIVNQRPPNAKIFNQALNNSQGPNGITLSNVAKIFRNAGYDNITKQDLDALITYIQRNPRSFRKGQTAQIIQPSTIIRTYLDKLVKSTYAGKDVFVSTKEDFGERKSLNVLSNVAAERMDDIHSGAYLSSRGTMVHPINNGSEAQEMWARLQTPEIMAQYAEDPIYTNSQLLSVLSEDSEHRAAFDIKVLDVLNDNSRRTGNGKTYGQLSTFDALTSRINAYFAGLGDKNYFYAFSPTQADRGNLQVITVPKMNIDEIGKAGNIFRGKQLADTQIRTWIRNQVESEIIRIAREKQKKSGYQNYGKNAVKFNLFTDLNTMDLTELTTRPRSIEAFTNKAMGQMSGIFRNIIDTDMAYYVDNGIFTRAGNEFKSTLESRKVLSKDLGTTTKGEPARKLSVAEMENFIANNFIYTYEQTLFYIGDPAFYNSTNDARQKTDMNKRFGLPFTPGVRLAVGDYTGMSETAKVVILKEGKYDSELADVYNNITGASMFKGIDLADGAGFVSLRRYKQTMLARGLHSDALLKLIDQLEAWEHGKPLPKSEVTLEVLKSFYFRIQQGKNGIMAPFNMKYSILPVIPTVFEQKIRNEQGKLVDKFPAMAKISRELRKGKVDEIVMQSAVKVGQTDITTLETLQDAVPTTIQNESYRFPQVSPSNQKIEDTFGSQIRNLILGNYDFKGDLQLHEGTISADEAFMLYNEAISTMVKENGDEVYLEFLTNGKVNKQALINKLLRDVEKNTFNNAEYFQEALTVIDDANNSMLPLSYPTVKYKLDNLINAAFRHQVNRLKLPGHSAVQISSYGMANKENISVESDLAFVSFKDKDGNRVSDKKALELSLLIKTEDGMKNIAENYSVAPAEIRTTPKFFKGTLEKVAKSKVREDMDYINKEVEAFRKSIPETVSNDERNTAVKNMRKMLMHDAEKAIVKNLLKMITDKNGNYDIKEIKKAGLDEVVIYRIPTQGKNTMLVAKIIDFMDPSIGGTVQVPAEIVDQAGSDFDIDKIYVEMNSFDVKDGKIVRKSYLQEDMFDVSTQDRAKAYIVDFHRAVLSSPKYIAELLYPNGTPTLGKLIDDFNLTDELTSSWASINTQETFRSNNKSGKELISISSISSVMHAIAPHIGAKFIKPINIGGESVTLGRYFNHVKTNKSPVLISSEIAEIQNAAVDNARDPLLGKLNIDTYTANVVLFMVSAGYGLKFATAVVNAPIIRELAKVYPKYTRKYSKDQSETKAVREVRKKYNINSLKPNSVKSVYSMKNYTEKDAVRVLSSDTQLDAAVALRAFMDIKRHGEALSTFQQKLAAAGSGSQGVPSSVAKLIERYAGMAGIDGTNANRREYHNRALTRKTEVIQGKVYDSRKAMEKTLKSKSVQIALTADEKNYKNVNTGELYQRLSEYIGNTIDRGALSPTRAAQMAASEKVGIVIDDIVRDFFITGKVLPRTDMSSQAIETLEDRLVQLKNHFNSTGEVVITDKAALKVFDDILKVGGEKDLVTIDDNKVYRIYDVKTAAKTKPEHYADKTKGEGYIRERFEKRGRQLNGYRGITRNSTGIIAEALNIIEFQTDYNQDGSYIDKIGKSDTMFENHPIDESVIRDTRVFDSNKTERILDKLGRTKEKSAIAVRPDLYQAHHLSTLEDYTLAKPLEVNRVVSPSASIQMQSVLKIATEKFGFMTENQQIQLMAAYDTYLAMNSGAAVTSKSTLSRRLSTEEFLDLSDPTSPDATANLLDTYRKNIAKNNIAENKFTENLTIVNQDGRSFVTFNNTIARALTGEAKKSMMFFFEDLMYSNDPAEYKLAKSLADYAVIHYGFIKGINSFMEFLPPSAHVEYMGGKQGQGQVTLPDHFRALENIYDSKDRFEPNPDKFVRMYAQNNAEKMNIRRIPYGTLGWKEAIAREAMLDRRPMPTYVLTEGRDFTNKLFELQGKDYKLIQRRGIPNLMVEYHNKINSVVNDIQSTVEMNSDASKSKASDENKVIIKNITRRADVSSFSEVLGQVADYQTMTFANATAAKKFVGEVKTYLENETELNTEEVNLVDEILTNFVVRNSERIAKKSKGKLSFDAVFKEQLAARIFDTLNHAMLNSRRGKMLNRIKICN